MDIAPVLRDTTENPPSFRAGQGDGMRHRGTILLLAWLCLYGLIQPGRAGAAEATAFDPEAERIGTLRLGQSLDKALAGLGCAVKKGRERLEAASGDYVQTLTLADCGLELKVAGPRKGGPKTVAAITVTAPSRLATRLGIRLGDDEPTVLAAYGRFRDPDGTSRPGEVLVAGSLFGGLIFEFEQGKLVRMFLGAAAE